MREGGTTAGRGRSDRNQVVEEYAYLVNRVARKMAGRLPPNVELDDLKSVGVIGLIDAAERYEEGRGSFKAYAEIRIQGAIVDSLRKNDFVPRSVRRKKARIDQAMDMATRRLGRQPKRRELARMLDTDEQDDGWRLRCWPL